MGAFQIETVVWGVVLLLLGGMLLRGLLESIRLWLRERRGIPLLVLGPFQDPAQRLPGLPYHLAAHLTEAGLAIFDEKGLVRPDFDLVGEGAPPQIRLLARLTGLLPLRRFQRISLEVTGEPDRVSAGVALTDSATGYVRYLGVLSLKPGAPPEAGRLVEAMARQAADLILIALSRDANTRGLLYQRMGRWSMALKEFRAAADRARQSGRCGEYYQAHLNLGNLYSLLGMHDKSVAVYTEVADQVCDEAARTLLQAALACSYRSWAAGASPEAEERYDHLAERAIAQALSSAPRTPLIHYTVACYWSLSRRYEESLHWLREAVALDPAYLAYAEADPDIAHLLDWLDGRPLADGLGLRLCG